MRVSRRLAMVAFIGTIGIAATGAVIGVALVRLYRSIAVPAQPLSTTSQHGPSAMVDQSTWDLGIIESGEEFAHVFVIRNEGNAPLHLSPGATSCKCMAAQLPESPIAAGGQAEVRVGPTEAARAEELKSGPIGRAVEILTNDPDHVRIPLKVKATVRRRLAAAASPLHLIIHAADLSSQSKRTAETVVYSQVWDAFELAAVKTSREGVQCRIDQATGESLENLHARSGYRLTVTLPAELQDGQFAEWIDLAGSPQEQDAAAEGRSLRLEIQGRVDGRVTFHGRKMLAGKVLRLGVLQTGEGARERLLMKIQDEQRSLTVQEVQTQPPFMRVHVAPQAGGLQAAGLYQIEVEVPDDAPPCAFTGQRRAAIRLKTDHPRLPVIELKVDFAVLGVQPEFRQMTVR